MNSRIAMALVAGGWVVPVHAADLISNKTTQAEVHASTAVHAMTIEESALISPGHYTASIAPIINSSMAVSLQKAIAKIKGMSGVQADAADSSVHFVVKTGASIRLVDIQKAVADADTGAVMSVPVLEDSFKANPGL